MELAQRIYPIPAARDFTAELDQDKKGLPTLEKRRQQVQAQLLKQYGPADPKQLTVSPYGQTLYEAENEETEIYEQHFARLFASYEQQNRFYQMAAFVTPHRRTGRGRAIQISGARTVRARAGPRLSNTGRRLGIVGADARTFPAVALAGCAAAHHAAGFVAAARELNLRDSACFGGS